MCNMVKAVAIRDSVSRFLKKCNIVKCGNMGEVVFKDVQLRSKGEYKMYVYCIDHALSLIHI